MVSCCFHLMGHCGNLVSFSSATIKLLKLRTNHWCNWKQHLPVQFLYDDAKGNNRLYFLQFYLLFGIWSFRKSVQQLKIYVHISFFYISTKQQSPKLWNKYYQHYCRIKCKAFQPESKNGCSSPKFQPRCLACWKCKVVF